MPYLVNPRWVRECPKCKNYDEWWVKFHDAAYPDCRELSLDPYSILGHQPPARRARQHLHVQCPTCGFSIIEAPESERDHPA